MSTERRDSPAPPSWRELSASVLPFAVSLAVVAALALTIGWSINGGDGFGIALGIIGTAGAVLAAIDAHISAARVERAVGNARAAAEASSLASEAARAAADEVRALTADLTHADRARRRKLLRDAVRHAAQQLDDSLRCPETDHRGRLSAVQLLGLSMPVATALEESGHLSLHACRALVTELIRVAAVPTASPFVDDDRKVSSTQLAELLGLARAAWDEVKPGSNEAGA